MSNEEAIKRCREFAYIKMSPLAEAVSVLLEISNKQQEMIDKMADCILKFMPYMTKEQILFVFKSEIENKN